MRRAALALALGLAAAACGGEPDAPRYAAPTSPRASLVMQPAALGVGEVALLELSVVTPPDHRVGAYRPPESVPGLWVLGAEATDVDRQPGRWVHRTRLRVRAREVGSFEWPGGSVTIQGPEGIEAPLSFDALPIEVGSILPEYPDRLTPFGVRTASEPDGGASSLVSGAAGALLTLGALGLVRLARRRAREARAAVETPAAAAPEPPWVPAREALAAARRRAPDDPLGAAHATAALLRRYMAHRFRADAEARTTEELEAAKPPFAATSRWPVFVAILRGLDEWRFRPEAALRDRASVSERVRALQRQAEELVEDSIPPESRR